MSTAGHLIFVLLVGVTLGAVADFCWKDTYGRGVGTIPNQCPGRNKIGLLCYDYCPSGYQRVVLDCHQKCKSGWRDDGLFCRLAEYGRGAGFPWKFKDGFNDRGMFKRCESKHGKGNCEKNGAIVYPKCRSGYHNIGCCICRPNTPNCRAEGYNGGIDLSCAIKIIIGKPKSMSCPSDKQNDAGLCYTPCREGYDGVGPVCWGRKPSGWVNCGMGAAPTSGTCAKIVFDQVTSVGQVAFNIATFGSSSAVTKSASTIKDAAELKKTFKTLKDLYDNTKEVREIVNNAKTAVELAETAKDAAEIATADEDEVSEADIIRMAAALAALVDPTGISGVVAAYSYPLCSQI